MSTKPAWLTVAESRDKNKNKNNNNTTTKNTNSGGSSSSSYSSNSYNNSGSSSGGSSNKSSGNFSYTTNGNTINTNTSYNGSYLNVDKNTDYQALINKAVASGDYKSAAVYEAQRNAKIDYLNATTGSSYQKTNNYVNNYAYNNGSGGTVYESNGSLNNLQNGVTTVNGANYKKDNTGIYQQTGRDTTTGAATYTKVGDSYNPQTKEFMWNDVEGAKRAYVDQMIGVGMANPNDTYDSLLGRGKVEQGYLSAIQSGNVGNYTESVRSSVAKMQAAEEARIQAEKARLQSIEDARIQAENDRLRRIEEERNRYLETQANLERQKQQAATVLNQYNNPSVSQLIENTNNSARGAVDEANIIMQSVNDNSFENYDWEGYFKSKGINRRRIIK